MMKSKKMPEGHAQHGQKTPDKKKKVKSMFGSNPNLPPFEEKDRFECREYP